MMPTHIHPDNVHEFSHALPRIWLDGEEMGANLITEVNEAEGYIILAVTGKAGLIFVDPRNDTIRKVKLSGLVQLTFGGFPLSKEQAGEVAALFRKKHRRVG